MNAELQKLRKEAHEAAVQAREEFQRLFGYSHDAETKGAPTGWRRIPNGDGTFSWQRDDRGRDTPPAAIARAERKANRALVAKRPRF